MENRAKEVEARVGFEPTNGGFADLSLRPLGYRALDLLCPATSPLKPTAWSIRSIADSTRAAKYCAAPRLFQCKSAPMLTLNCSQPRSWECQERIAMRSLATASWTLRFLILSLLLGFCSSSAFSQGGPPYYTNDTATPGNHLWEINIAYMPFFYTDSSLSHIPDVDINYGIGGHVQLTFESAWLRDHDSPAAPKYGLEQDQLGVKWTFYDDSHSRLAISVFPQLSINNPNHSVQRGLAPPGASFLLPVDLSKKLWRIHLNWE